MTGRHELDGMTGWMRGLGLPVAFLLANGLLLAPGWILRGAPGPPWLAGEALLAVAVFLLLPARRWTGFVAGGVAGFFVASSVLLLGDAAARASLSRPLNLYLDWHLLDAVWKLMAGAVGAIPAGLGLFVLAAATGLAGWGIGRLLAEGRSGDRLSRARIGIGGALAVLLLVFSGWNGFWSAVPRVSAERGDPPTAAEEAGHVPIPALGRVVGWPSISLAVDQVQRVGALLEERERFARELEGTPSSHAGVPELLERLRGADVVLAFVESYGMTSLRDPRYAGILRPRLHELERRMGQADLALATGSLVAPTQGGQSWFSHGSLLSGLWLDNQLKYDVLLTTGRETLVDDFSRAGYETVALMPAITLAWPEGEWFGYDRIYDFHDIDYAGPPLNWVTMPDQFTWSFLQHRILSPGRAGDSGHSGSLAAGTGAPDSGSGGTEERRRPVFAEVGLISSHAPWTPILPVLSDWGSIGDGSIFAPWENAGERPEELWRDVERVREHFALSVDYAVHAMTSYAERYVDDETLLIVMGDHQPAPLITGDGAGRAVPVHVISGNRDLVNPFVEWGFRRGALPDMERKPLRMDAFREWFVKSYSGPIGAPREPRPRETP